MTAAATARTVDGASFPPSLALVAAAFPAQGLIPAVRAGAFIGFAESTTYNRLSAGTFPLPVVKLGGKLVMVRAVDLARFIESAAEAAQVPQIALPKRRRGRPTNAERAARERALRLVSVTPARPHS